MRLHLQTATLALAALLLAPAARAQPALDGAWIKLDLRHSGYVVDTQTGAASRAKRAFTGYMQFESDLMAGDCTYTFQVWCETSPGVWEPVSKGLCTPLAGETLASDVELTLGSKGESITGRVSLRIKVKHDANGKVAGATLRSVAGLVTGGELADGAKAPVGALRARGKTVQPEALPFQP